MNFIFIHLSVFTYIKSWCFLFILMTVELDISIYIIDTVLTLIQMKHCFILDSKHGSHYMSVLVRLPLCASMRPVCLQSSVVNKEVCEGLDMALTGGWEILRLAQ